jgi:hypothetical protein
MTNVNQIQSRTLISTAKVNAFPLAALGDDVREPHKGVILQVKGGDELRPFVGQTLIVSILNKAFKGEL